MKTFDKEKYEELKFKKTVEKECTEKKPQKNRKSCL